MLPVSQSFEMSELKNKMLNALKVLCPLARTAVRFEKVEAASPEEIERLPFKSPVRAAEWLQARKLETLVRQDLLDTGVAQDAIALSVSHTQFETESWVIVVGGDRRMGVDLEWRGRELSEKVFVRTVSEKEQWEGLKPLDYWVAKEAVFKSNPHNSGTTLPDYQVILWDTNLAMGEISYPGGFGRFKLVYSDVWLVGFAVSGAERNSV